MKRYWCFASLAVLLSGTALAIGQELTRTDLATGLMFAATAFPFQYYGEDWSLWKDVSHASDDLEYRWRISYPSVRISTCGVEVRARDKKAAYSVSRFTVRYTDPDGKSADQDFIFSLSSDLPWHIEQGKVLTLGAGGPGVAGHPMGCRKVDDVRAGGVEKR